MAETVANEKVGLSSPWATCAKKIMAMFKDDEEITIKFDETNYIMLGEKRAQENVLNGTDGAPIMKLIAIYDQAHWNWKPEASYLWEFFKNFSR